eukprot:4327400-Alexandrium_andersonii.AAC.1
MVQRKLGDVLKLRTTAEESEAAAEAPVAAPEVGGEASSATAMVVDAGALGSRPSGEPEGPAAAAPTVDAAAGG